MKNGDKVAEITVWEVNTDLTFVDGKGREGFAYIGLGLQMKVGDRFALRFPEGELDPDFSEVREGWYAVSDSNVHYLHARNAHSFTRRYTLERMEPQPE
ncbi:MAG: hypothetical protein HYW25_04345 [Candidatus Aenigmarchaeota archaeon]|nr:hypothetical protein [Candidatus Aenigmarchaeota archaeon]